LNGRRWDVADAGQAGVPGVSGNANSQFVTSKQRANNKIINSGGLMR
jgi:hypothetical protein